MCFTVEYIVYLVSLQYVLVSLHYNEALSLSFRLELIPPRGGVRHECIRIH